MNWADSDTALESFLPDWIETAAPVCLADPPCRDRLRDSVAHARRNPLWQPTRSILEQHLAEQTGCPDAEHDPGLQSFVLLITILVEFLETAARLLSPIRPGLSLTFAEGISRSIKATE